MVAAHRAFSGAFDIFKGSDDLYSLCIAGFKLGVCRLHMGELYQAENVCREHTEFAERYHLASVALIGGFYALRGEISREWGDLKDELRIGA